MPATAKALREYQMKSTENTKEATATTMSRTNRGGSRERRSASRHLICASAENP